MNIIKGMLKEELENSLRIKKRFINALNEVPRGSLQNKNIKGHHYYYLNLREGAKVKSLYIGKLSLKEFNAYKENDKKKRKYRQSIKELNQQIKYLKRVLSVKSE